MGTLDSLLALSDDLVKTTNLVEAVVAKVRRQLVELEGTSEEAEVRGFEGAGVAGAWVGDSLRVVGGLAWRATRGGNREDHGPRCGLSPLCLLRARLEAQFACGPPPALPHPQHADARAALLLHALGYQATGLSVDGVPVKRFISGFVWNEAKCVASFSPHHRGWPADVSPAAHLFRHPARRPLRETAEKLAEGVARLEEELKVKTAEYNGLKSQLGALTRKAGGNLATRDLGDISAFAAQKQLVVESEHMTTLFGVVPAHSAPEWRASYEKLAKFVVPRSSKLVRRWPHTCEARIPLFIP